MRLIKQNIERDGSGFVTLYPEDSEDMVIASSSLSPATTSASYSPKT